MRLRFSVLSLMLATLVAGLALFGAEMVRRALEPRRPLLEWPWWTRERRVTLWWNTYVHMHDVARGIDPPRAKHVWGDGRVEDERGGWSPEVLGWYRAAYVRALEAGPGDFFGALDQGFDEAQRASWPEGFDLRPLAGPRREGRACGSVSRWDN